MSDTHWNEVYNAKSPDERSWTQPLPTYSMKIIHNSSLALSDPIIDIGGGASLLPDTLLEENYFDITLLDISAAVIEETKQRLGDRAHYICADITQWKPERTYKFWHDRAVFHFLSTSEQQTKYRDVFLNGTQSGSHLVIATFAPTGPESCSGLPVQRWSQDELASFFSTSCDIIGTNETVHTTPWGSTQPFTWVHARRK